MLSSCVGRLEQLPQLSCEDFRSLELDNTRNWILSAAPAASVALGATFSPGHWSVLSPSVDQSSKVACGLSGASLGRSRAFAFYVQRCEVASLIKSMCQHVQVRIKAGKRISCKKAQKKNREKTFKKGKKRLNLKNGRSKKEKKGRRMNK